MSQQDLSLLSTSDFFAELTKSLNQSKTETNISESGDNSITINKSSAPDAKIALPPNGIYTGDLKLSDHFVLGHFFDGGFNHKHILRDQCGLSQAEIVGNLKALAENVVEKIAPHLPGGIEGYGKSWRITSGYRMGECRSDHNRGRACDIQISGRNKKEHWMVSQQLVQLFPFDQFLLEYRGRYSVWIHCSYRGSKNRHQVMTMVNDRKYSDGLVCFA